MFMGNMPAYKYIDIDCVCLCLCMYQMRVWCHRYPVTGVTNTVDCHVGAGN